MPFLTAILTDAPLTVFADLPLSVTTVLGGNLARDDVVGEDALEQLLVLGELVQRGLGHLREGSVGGGEDRERALALERLHEARRGEKRGEGLELAGSRRPSRRCPCSPAGLAVAGATTTAAATAATARSDRILRILEPSFGLDNFVEVMSSIPGLSRSCPDLCPQRTRQRRPTHMRASREPPGRRTEASQRGTTGETPASVSAVDWRRVSPRTAGETPASRAVQLKRSRGGPAPRAVPPASSACCSRSGGCARA